MKMTIADLIKYVDFLKERQQSLVAKVRQVETTRTSTRVVSANETTKVVEQEEYTISPKELMGEYDTTAKELRLARQTLERLNHTTETDFEAKF